MAITFLDNNSLVDKPLVAQLLRCHLPLSTCSSSIVSAFCLYIPPTRRAHLSSTSRSITTTTGVTLGNRNLTRILDGRSHSTVGCPSKVGGTRSVGCFFFLKISQDKLIHRNHDSYLNIDYFIFTLRLQILTNSEDLVCIWPNPKCYSTSKIDHLPLQRGTDT